ncbi:MAG TPA: hypothetical protein EYH17_03455 [Pyrodictium sp.]|nr:hypothetical protein [Pyrodictium sp.]
MPKKKKLRLEMLKKSKSLCRVCGMPADYKCKMCGFYFCKQHIGSDKICILCSEALCRLCGKYYAISNCPVCGRIVCDQCSVQITPVVRVCKECYNRLEKPSAWPPQELVRKSSEYRLKLGKLVIELIRQRS